MRDDGRLPLATSLSSRPSSLQATAAHSLKIFVFFSPRLLVDTAFLYISIDLLHVSMADDNHPNQEPRQPDPPNEEQNPQPPQQNQANQPQNNNAGGRPVLDESRNPFRAKCPNFHAIEWDEARQRLIDDLVVPNDEEAVVHLVQKWQQTIERKKAEWLRDGGRDPGPEEPVEQRKEQERGRRRERGRARRSESSSTMSSRSGGEERERRHRSRKIPPIPLGRAGPDSVTDPPPRAVITKLKELEYVELAHFTASARERAKRDRHNAADETLALTRLTNALTITTTPSSRSVRPDDELSWDEVMQARVQYLTWLEKTKWPHEYVAMMTEFFWRLDSHDLRGQTGGTDILVRYQALYRREWHDALREGHPFDLATINESALANLKAQVLQDTLTASVRQMQVGFLFAFPL